MTTFLDSANAKFAMSVTLAAARAPRLRVYRLTGEHALAALSLRPDRIDTALVR